MIISDGEEQLEDETSEAVDNVHTWLAVQARRGVLLHVGLEQPGQLIRLAQGGFIVVGIDEAAAHVTAAEARLQSEPEEVRARLQFRCRSLDAGVGVLEGNPDRLFDTVILGASALCKDDPAAVITQAMERVTQAGRVLIAIPLGVSSPTGTEITPNQLCTWAAALGEVQELALIGNRICLSVTRQGLGSQITTTDILRLTEKGLQVERETQKQQRQMLRTLEDERTALQGRLLRLQENLARMGHLIHDQLAQDGDGGSVARCCDQLIREASEDPEAQLTLARIACDLSPHPARDKQLGIALSATGHLDEARRLFANVSVAERLSSGEQRQLDRLQGDSARPIAPAQPDLRIAAWLNGGLAAALAPDCDLMCLNGADWREDISVFAPDLVLTVPEQDFPTDLFDYCDGQDIPSAVWITDPNVSDEDMARAASGARHVLLANPGRISACKALMGHDRVHLMLPACQPRLHNPLTGPVLHDGGGVTDARPTAKVQAPTVDSAALCENDSSGAAKQVAVPHALSQQGAIAPEIPACLASGRSVVSPYSYGHRLLFGDLLLSSNSAEELDRRRAAMTAPVQLVGLRKVLEQHTWGHRLARLASIAGLSLPDPVAPRVTVFAQAGSVPEAEALMRHVQRQSLRTLSMVVVLEAGAQQAAPQLEAAGYRWVPEDQADAISAAQSAENADWIAFFHPEDYYGPHYLRDLVLASGFTAAEALGKGGFHRCQGGRVHVPQQEQIYTAVRALDLRATLLRADQLSGRSLAAWSAAIATGKTEVKQAVSLDPYGYCRTGYNCTEARILPGVTQQVDDPEDLNTGAQLADLEEVMDHQPAQISGPGPGQITGAELAMGFDTAGIPDVDWRVAQDGWHFSSTLEPGTHRYVFQDQDRPLQDLLHKGRLGFHLVTTPGLHLLWVLLFFDAGGNRIGDAVLHANENVFATPPEGAVQVRFGLRVRGPGAATVYRLYLGERHPYQAPWVPTGAATLLLTNQYPSYEALYNNAFVHQRLRAYAAQGKKVDVFRLQRDQDLQFSEFENTDCATGSRRQLNRILQTEVHSHVLVHFLTPDMWTCLKPHLDRIKLTVWVHGADIQPWWRREHDHTTDLQRARAKEASATRTVFWREVLTDLHPNLHLVFVSDYLAQQAMEDLELQIPKAQYSVIHNPIDTKLFAYQPKDPEQRYRVLSVRPHTSRTYANDLVVQAILKLQDHPEFDRLSFHLIGDGALFETTVAPVRNLPNVTLEQGFLTQTEIARRHREAGIFLCPSRMDSQGVSRDEAMSSGLVPVTTDIGAIPDFVNESCGFLAPPEDAEALAEAIANLVADPERFQQLSRNAAARVRGQSRAAKITRQELVFLA